MRSGWTKVRGQDRYEDVDGRYVRLSQPDDMSDDDFVVILDQHLADVENTPAPKVIAESPTGNMKGDN